MNTFKRGVLLIRYYIVFNLYYQNSVLCYLNVMKDKCKLKLQKIFLSNINI